MNSSRSYKMRRFFAIDIDKTFYIEDSDKFQKNVESFNKLSQNSIVPFFCTGRICDSAMTLMSDKFVEKTGYNGYPGVYANGAVVYDFDGNIISQTVFSKNFLERFIKHLIENDLEDHTIFGEADRFYYLKELSDDFKNYPKDKDIRILQKINPEELVNKKIVSININKEVEIEDLTEFFTLKVCANDSTFHISPKNVTKAYGVKKLLEHLNVPHEQCSFIGNGNNDIELLEFCTLSYAVGNANDRVKSAAKIVLKETYDQGAFQKAVKLITAT